MERPPDRQRRPKNALDESNDRSDRIDSSFLRPPPAPIARLRNNGRKAPKPPRCSTVAKRPGVARPDFSPLPWNLAFERHLFVRANRASFSFYTAGTLHENHPPQRPVLVLLHGGGCTALSFCAVVKRIRDSIPVIAFDQRAHGLTTTDDPADIDIHIDTLAQDAVAALTAFFLGNAPESNNTNTDDNGHDNNNNNSNNNNIPPLILAGHSMGGGVVAHVAHSKKLPVIATILIDVTEGTAIEALPYMNAWVTNRPRVFQRISGAIEYVIARGHVRNLESARFSVPSQLVELDIDNGRGWAWRTDLAATQRFWKGWFTGLSQLFLSAPCGPKLLVLAGVDRLDKKLTIAQMQGKFQNILIPEAGHSIHEDQPDKMAAVIREFLNRNLISQDSSHADLLTPNIFQQRKPVDEHPAP